MFDWISQCTNIELHFRLFYSTDTHQLWTIHTCYHSPTFLWNSTWIARNWSRKILGGAISLKGRKIQLASNCCRLWYWIKVFKKTCFRKNPCPLAKTVTHVALRLSVDWWSTILKAITQSLCYIPNHDKLVTMYLVLYISKCFANSNVLCLIINLET